jgi:hypothetical protein
MNGTKKEEIFVDDVKSKTKSINPNVKQSKINK